MNDPPSPECYDGLEVERFAGGGSRDSTCLKGEIMKRALLLALPVLVAGCDGNVFGIGACNVDREIYDELNAGSAAVVRILADEGNLEVRGRPGISRVRVTGRACAENRSTLNDIDLVLDRSGDVIRIMTFVRDNRRGDDGRLDLLVEVPADMIVDIEHTDGNIDVRDVRAAFIYDDDGSIRVENVSQDVGISDGSGNITIRRVGGDIYLLDESGHIDIHEVDGLVYIEEDGSGDIRVQDVLGDVYIHEDGSGDIEVFDIYGDFIVDYDSSGRITYRNVRGIVDIP